MDKESKVCIGCEVSKVCPPQSRADRITIAINQGTMPPRQRGSELSRLRQDIYRYKCPPSEKNRLVEPLVRLIHPSRNMHYNDAGIAPRSTPDVGYVADKSAELVSRARGAKARRTTR